MKYYLWFLPIVLVEILLAGYALSVNQEVSLIQWDPVCRHDAIYWASVVNEQYPIRFMFGRYFEDPIPEELKGFAKEQAPYTWHVQPQVKLEDNWYYFKVQNHRVVIFNMPPTFKKEYVMYKEDYVDYLFKIDRGNNITIYGDQDSALGE